jgi:hypothetical protein
MRAGPNQPVLFQIYNYAEIARYCAITISDYPHSALVAVATCLPALAGSAGREFPACRRQ